MAEEDKNAHRAETDLASEWMGRNKIQGDDEEKVHREKHGVPDARQEPDRVIESPEKHEKEEGTREDPRERNRGANKPTPAVSPGEQRNPDNDTAGEGDDTTENSA